MLDFAGADLKEAATGNKTTGNKELKAAALTLLCGISRTVFASCLAFGSAGSLLRDCKTQP